MIEDNRIHNPNNYRSDDTHLPGHTEAVFRGISSNADHGIAEVAQSEQWEAFNQRPLSQKLGIVAKRLFEITAKRLSSMSTRKKLAIAALPITALGYWGNTPHEVDSVVTYIETGDGGVRTTCDAAEKLAIENGLDPERGDNCVYAGQHAGRELTDSHPNKAIQPGEEIRVTILQSPLDKLLGDHQIQAYKA